MIITATELKTNLGKYLELVDSEEILITKNGKIIAQLSSPQLNKISILKELIGVAKNSEEVDEESIKAERLKRY